MEQRTDIVTLRSSSRVIFSAVASIAVMGGFPLAFGYLGLSRAGNDSAAVVWFCAGLFVLIAAAILFVFHGTPLEMIFADESIRVRRFLAGGMTMRVRDIRRVMIERYIMRARNMSIPRLRLVFEGERGVLWSVTQDQLKEAGTTPAAMSFLLRGRYRSHDIEFAGPPEE